MKHDILRNVGKLREARSVIIGLWTVLDSERSEEYNYNIILYRFYEKY